MLVTGLLADFARPLDGLTCNAIMLCLTTQHNRVNKVCDQFAVIFLHCCISLAGNIFLGCFAGRENAFDTKVDRWQWNFRIRPNVYAISINGIVSFSFRTRDNTSSLILATARERALLDHGYVINSASHTWWWRFCFLSRIHF